MQSKKTNREGRRAMQKKTFAVYAAWLARNVLFMVLALLLVRYALTEQPTYRWVYNSLLKENMAVIRKYPKLTFEEKMQMKLGMGYDYLRFIKQATPENAVILYPSQAAFQKEGSPFKREISNKLYATRFLHPRLLILESELEESKYAGKITHIAIVNGEGKERIPYQVDPEVKHAIFPIVQQKKQ
ncbi:hypothetical protein [uncultured Bacteroides sp.]|uniref:hypothetical protein n=1 Tax=uncultured Bacteroides sp. TaxID=162156 RepID=UPI0025CCA255|nr:hypothetical protein [uncultured Bacteroides sp.]